MKLYRSIYFEMVIWSIGKRDQVLKIRQIDMFIYIDIFALKKKLAFSLWKRGLSIIYSYVNDI